MTLNPLQTLDIIEIMEGYLARKRPPEELREQIDLGYRIDDQSIFFFTIRPSWQDKKIIREHDFAKTTFVQSKGIWKLYWMRGNLKWDEYKTDSPLQNLREVVKEVEDDKYGCFFG